MKAQGPLSDPARTLVRGALGLAPNEHLVLVEDEATRAIADAVNDAADAVGAWVRRIRLDGFARRPIRLLPDLARQALADARASVFLASEMHQEASMRQAILHIVRERGLRHAHMPGITERGFVAGLRTPPEELQRMGEQLQGLLSGARTLVTESPGGTSLRITLEESARWFAQVGVIRPGEWANLPAGAFYASPASVDGVFVADASLGEFFGARAGLLAGNEVRFHLEDSHVVEVTGADASLLRDLRATLAVAPNSDRIGLLAVGLNAGVERPVGEFAIDQNLPGLHLGIGDPAGRSSGATWRAQTCFAACQARSTVAVDGIVVVRDGVLVGLSPRKTTRSGQRPASQRLPSPTPTR